jgi:hypothetical protein
MMLLFRIFSIGRPRRQFLRFGRGFDPIDLTPRSIGALAADNTRLGLDEFRWHATERYHFPVRGLKLFIIGANSD